MNGFILYGPPGSGKSTLAREIVDMDQDYFNYKLLRSDAGDAEYRPFNEASTLIWETTKYGRRYGIDLEGFEDSTERTKVVIQIGETKAVEALLSLGITWVVVFLWCPRDVAAHRLSQRNSNVEERLAAWDNTEPVRANVVFNTARFSAGEIARNLISDSNPLKEPTAS